MQGYANLPLSNVRRHYKRGHPDQGRFGMNEGGGGGDSYERRILNNIEPRMERMQIREIRSDDGDRTVDDPIESDPPAPRQDEEQPRVIDNDDLLSTHIRAPLPRVLWLTKLQPHEQETGYCYFCDRMLVDVKISASSEKTGKLHHILLERKNKYRTTLENVFKMQAKINEERACRLVSAFYDRKIRPYLHRPVPFTPADVYAHRRHNPDWEIELPSMSRDLFDLKESISKTALVVKRNRLNEPPQVDHSSVQSYLKVSVALSRLLKEKNFSSRME